MITKPFVGVLWVLCAAAASASAAETTCVTVEQGWARLPPNPAMPMTAGYGVIHNRCGKAVVITGAASSSFAGCARSSACRWHRAPVPSSSPVACT
ncbi:hypothetical protein G6F24_018693 [Rhizopus arrhizus]|nr:hypothetical protein G6F24_018693 [Rhizopus arrhizus]